MFYAVIGVAIASLTDRRIVAGAAIIGLFLVTSIASGVLVHSRGGGSTAPSSTCWPCRCTCATSCSSGTSIRPPLGGVSTAGGLPLPLYVVVLAAGTGVLLWRYRWVER